MVLMRAGICVLASVMSLCGCESEIKSRRNEPVISTAAPTSGGKDQTRIITNRPADEKPEVSADTRVQPLSPSTDSELAGQVVDDSGSPVADAEIKVEPAIWESTDSSTPTLGLTRSATSGQFRVIVQPMEGRAVVSAIKTGYTLKAPARVKLDAGTVNGNISLTLYKEKEAAGTVMDAAGNPIPNATVMTREVPSTLWKNSVSGPDGRFPFGAIKPEGSVTLQAWANGYTTATKTISGAELSNVSVVLLPQIKGTFTGYVWDRLSNSPITTATIRATDNRIIESSAKAANAFEIKNVGPGEKIRVIVSGPGYGTHDSGIIRIPDGMTSEERHFRLGAGGTVTGRVVTKDATPLPISGALVYAGAEGTDSKAIPTDIRTKLETYTDKDGRFTLPSLAQDSWTITALQENTSFKKDRAGIVVTDAQTEDIGDIRLGEIIPGNVNMKVVRLPEKTGVPGIQVLLWKSSTEEIKKTTSADGTISFLNINPGYYVVLVPDYELRSAVSVLEGEPTKDVVLFVGAGELRGKVTDAQGSGVQARISAESSSARKSKQAMTGADGSFVMTGLPPGMWDVTVNNGQRSILEQVQIKAGDTSEHVFRFPGGKITGTVVDKLGKPVGRASVSVSYRPTLLPLRNELAVSDNDGRFELNNLPEGDYRVDGVKNGPTTEVGHVANVKVNDTGEGKPIRLELSGVGGTLESYVYEMANGKPLPTAWCMLSTDNKPYGHNSKRDESGKTLIRNIPPGKYTVQIGAYSYSNVEREVEIQEGEVTTIQDVLYEAGALKLLVLNGDGMPAVGVDVEMESADSSSIEETKTGVTDLRGAWLYRGLSPGRYNLTVRSGLAQQHSTIVIQASGVTTLQVVLP